VVAKDESREATYEAADEALSAGDYEDVRRLVGKWARERPPDPEACALVGLSFFHEGDYPSARPLLEAALAADPDDHETRGALGACAFFGLELEAAERELTRVVRAEPDWAAGHYWLARLQDWRSIKDPQLAPSAARHFERAARLDPEGFSVPLSLSEREFDGVLQSAIRDLPPRIAAALEDVTIAVDAYPDERILESADDLWGPDLLGLYTGTALPDRHHLDSGRLPDVIHVFKRNLEIVCADREELIREIRDTLFHEVGHYLGLDEEDLEDLGL
jgi:predicted Zn-dependent protease with MMP-like domain